MSRYCELKLVDVFRVEKSEMSSKRNKITPDFKTVPSKTFNKNKCTTTELSDGFVSKNIIDNPSNKRTTNEVMEERETRLSKRTNNITKSKACQDLDKKSEKTDKVKPINISQKGKIKSQDQNEINSGKRKKYDLQVDNIGGPIIKRACSDSNNTTLTRNISSNPDQKITQQSKKKKKTTKSFWENKLTGARRVSKRLTNLRIKKKTLKDLGPLVDKSLVLIKQKQPVNFSARSKINAVEEFHVKSRRRVKSDTAKPAYNRNRTEVQVNFGKLSYTKRFYPKISTNKRPATYKVTIKSTGSVQRDLSDCTENRKRRGEPQSDNESGSESDNPHISSLITKCIEDIEDVVVRESGNESETDSSISQETQNNESNEQFKSNDPDQEHNDEDSTQGNVEVSVVCSNIEEGIDDSTIAIVDIEPSENVQSETSEEYRRIDPNTESKESAKENTTKSTSGNSSNSENSVEIICDSGSITSLEVDKNKEENKREGISKTNSQENDTEPNLENTIKEKTVPSSVDCSPIIETIDITSNTAE